MTYVGLGGAMLAIAAFCVYVADHHVPAEGRKVCCTNCYALRDLTKQLLQSNRFRITLCAASFLAVLLYTTFSTIRSEVTPLPSSPDTSSMPPIFADFTFIPPPPARKPICTRTELPSYSFYPGNRTYHKFDDVLLVVFFSHARYDVNLDYYKEVYSEFFPNVRSILLPAV